MQPSELAINERTLPNWKRPAELLAIVTAIQETNPKGWIKSAGQLQQSFRDLWQCAVAFYGLEGALGKEYRIHPSATEPFDAYAAAISEESRHADVIAVQNKMVTNHQSAKTSNFEPGSFATHIKNQISKYGNNPELIFLLYLNADALFDHYALHAALKETLSGESSIWLFGSEIVPSQEKETWFVRYVYPEIKKPGKYQFRIESLPRVTEEELRRYRSFVETLVVKNNLA